jgi:polyvinyl alcohol dehydrogenase (cytochrome)
MEGDVSANPAVQKDELYVPDWAGYLYKINSETGELIWKHSISEYAGIENWVSRTTPAITDDSIIIGDQNGGHLIAVDKHTGDRKWVTQF